MTPTLLSHLVDGHEELRRLMAEAHGFLAAHGRALVAPSDAGGPLRIALFGPYNAGKSTLVNALLGERRASTGDAPETKSPQSYACRGLLISDLPGGEARSAEEHAARLEAAGAHAVVCVVSSQTGLELRTFWADLDWLRRQRVPVLIVINDKTPHQDEASERRFQAEVLSKFRTTAAELGSDTSMDSVFWVNARRAERGRLEGKPALERASGIAALESSLFEALVRSDPLIRGLARAREVRAALRSFTSELAAADVSREVKDLERALRACASARERLSAAAEVIATEQFAVLGDAIAAVLGRGTEAPTLRDDVVREVTELCDAADAGAMHAFVTRCHAELVSLGQVVDAAALEKSAIAGKTASSLGTLPPLTEADVNPTDMLGRVAEAAKLAPAISRQLEQHAAMMAWLAREGTTSSRGVATRSATALVRGAAHGERTAARMLGPAIIVAVGAWEIYQAYQSVTKERIARELALQEVSAKAALAASIGRQQYLGYAAQLIAANVTPLEAQLREREVEGGARAQAIVSGGRLTEQLDVLSLALQGRTVTGAPRDAGAERGARE